MTKKKKVLNIDGRIMKDSDDTGYSPDFTSLTSDQQRIEEKAAGTGSFWYKGTPVSTDRGGSGSVVYDPFERQNFLRSFPPKSDRSDSGSESDELKEKLYYPNYFPPKN